MSLRVLTLLCLGTLSARQIQASGHHGSTSCGFPGLPANSVISPSDQAEFYNEDLVTFSCLQGFVMFGPEKRECVHGAWSISNPVCRENIALGQPATQSDTLWDFSPGLAVDGDLNSTCSFTPQTVDQRWWQVQLKAPVNIEAIAVSMNSDTVQHFTIFVIELLEGAKALYKPCSKFEGFFNEPRAVFLCNDGKGHFGEFVYIKDDRDKQEYLGLCEVQVFPFKNETDCGYPEQPLGSIVSMEGGVAFYSCGEGQALQGGDTRYCQQDGEWSGVAPSCTSVQCPDPVSPTSGYIEVSNFNGKYEFGAVASYRCNSGHILWGNSSSICGRDGSWQGSPPRCHLITCGNPPLVENAVVELLNGSTSWKSIIVYQCSAGYYDIMQDQFSIIVSECQADGNWSPVSLRCIFDPAAVARNMQRGHAVLWEEEEEMDIGTIIAISVICSLVIISLLISFIVISHRRKGALTRARKLSRLNGVKVLPDIITKREGRDCMEQKQDDLHTREVKTPEETVHGGHDMLMNKYSTQDTLYHKTSLSSFNMPLQTNAEETHSTDLKEIGNTSLRKDTHLDIYATIGRRKGNTRRPAEELEFDPYESVNCKKDLTTKGSSDGVNSASDESKEQVYESLGNFQNFKSSPLSSGKSEIMKGSNSLSPKDEIVQNAKSESNPVPCDLYAKVKKISSVSDGPNLNQDFVSIYELTKVDSNANLTEDFEPDLTASSRDKVQIKRKSESTMGNNSFETFSEPKIDHSFALDFSTSLSKGKQTCSENELDESDLYQEESEESPCETFRPNDSPPRMRHKYVESDPIPKMNINMFIQKDVKQNVRSWPKVETHPTNKRPKEISPTKQLIGKFNNGLNQPVQTRPLPNKLKSPTKLLINKFNNPNDINKKPVPGGFQGINPITSSNSQHRNKHLQTKQSVSHFQSRHLPSQLFPINTMQTPSKSPVPLPRFQTSAEPSQVHKLVTAMNTSNPLPDEEDEAARVSILKRNCGLHGWQAADI